ncbi:protein FAR1-RELATED SEQUENCE 5-like [Bidens hawaiensis]|uniref:protein FAR1-RELATED SEQUENCE 5-like n=1 Tax=Bidens hawaiensis TaxID=980011 RepID=UPI0040492D09
MGNESITHNVQTISIPSNDSDGNHHLDQTQAVDPENSELLIGQSSVPRVISLEQNDEPICLYSSDGSKCWIPNVPSHEKPSIGLQFKTWDDAVAMYKAYAAKAGFDVSKAGAPRCKDVDTMDTSSSASKRRQTNIKVTGCSACIKLKVPSNSVSFEIYDFIEAHNHGLVSDYNMDLTRGRRQLQFLDKEFIQNLQAIGFGPVVAHRVQSSLKGGQHLVMGSKTDFKNHARNVRYCVADADAQMIVDRFTHNMSHLKDFFSNSKLLTVCYGLYSGLTAYLDATTVCLVKHGMIFVPYTGVDCHKKCVTFGAGLIHSETIDSYKWLLDAFLSAHGKQPRLVLTNQDPAMKQAVSSFLNESTHRLCMWHVTNNIPVKLKGEIQVNEEIRCRVNKLVWNVFIKPETFESRWHDLIDEFNVSENKWLKDMFAIRESWVPAYFRDVPMCCLMKTTSRCESSNSQFKVYSSPGNNLVQFMNCFEMALNAQRHVQRELQNDTITKTPPLEIRLPIEHHASYVYTITIFKEVQKDITKGLYHCARTRVDSADGLNIHLINHKDKRNGFVGEFKVTQNPNDNTFSCSCKGFTRIGYLCRHIFKVLQIELIDEIPDKYILSRWRSDVIPSSLFKIETRYGVPLDERSKLRQQFLSLTNQCADRARGNIELLQLLVDQMNQIKVQIWGKIPIEPSYNINSAIIQDLIGYKLPEQVESHQSGLKIRVQRNHKKVMEEKECRRKEREQRRKERQQRRKEKMATTGNQPAEYAETDETVDTSETDSSEDSDDTSDTDYNTE